MEDYYAILGVPPFCSDKGLLRKRYLQQIKFFHPDQKNVSENIAIEKTHLLNTCYEVLTDENRKLEYDSKLRLFIEQEKAKSGNADKRSGNQSKHPEEKASPGQKTDAPNRAQKNSESQRHENKYEKKKYSNGISYNIQRNVGVLSSRSGGWNKEINIVSWNGRPAKYDIRDWSPNHDKMGKGITLTDQEARQLYDFLKKLFG